MSMRFSRPHQMVPVSERFLLPYQRLRVDPAGRIFSEVLNFFAFLLSKMVKAFGFRDPERNLSRPVLGCIKENILGADFWNSFRDSFSLSMRNEPSFSSQNMTAGSISFCPERDREIFKGW